MNNRNISILDSLKTKGIDEIIIYGASDFALRLLEQCEKEQTVKVAAISDKMIIKNGRTYRGIPLVTIDSIKSAQQGNIYIVITAVGFMEQILNDFKRREINNFITIDDLIYDSCASAI